MKKLDFLEVIPLLYQFLYLDLFSEDVVKYLEGEYLMKLLSHLLIFMLGIGLSNRSLPLLFFRFIKKSIAKGCTQFHKSNVKRCR